MTTLRKCIKTEQDLETFQKSEACQKLTSFIAYVGESVQGKKLRDAIEESAAVKAFVEILDRLDEWLTAYPPVDQPMRFGNTAFRDWHARVEEESSALILEILPSSLTVPPYAVPELAHYFSTSFGNPTRIDYGTGHELNFGALLCSLFCLEALTEADRAAAVLRIFQRYLQLARKVRCTYQLEPAGSHGVWGLDDHHHLAYIWGAYQLIPHKQLRPNSFVDPEITATYARDYMFLDCIKHVNEVKTGPFHEHSPMLWDISAVPSWEKVQSGLVKMFKVEVLHKVPIMQHFWFGSLLPFEQTEQSE